MREAVAERTLQRKRKEKKQEMAWCDKVSALWLEQSGSVHGSFGNMGVR